MTSQYNIERIVSDAEERSPEARAFRVGTCNLGGGAGKYDLVTWRSDFQARRQDERREVRGGRSGQSRLQSMKSGSPKLSG